VSLDAFRGLTILGMLLVNNIALDTATPKHFTHAAWNQGVNLADLVFPWFIFIVGVAIPYSFASHRARGLPIWRFDKRAVSRAIILVLLGCLIDSSLIMKPIFDLGVLQLIGLAYLVAALFAQARTMVRLSVAVVLLVGHWALLRFLPIPGAGAGVLTESVNAVALINSHLQTYHLQGLLSVAPTAGLALIGTVVGDLLHATAISELRRFFYVALSGVVMAAIGWLWSLDLPFNKSIWTASYILYTAGLGAVTLAFFYLVIDVKRWRSWAFPLVVFGMNAITAYVAPILVKLYILQGWSWQMPSGDSVPLQQAYLHWLQVSAGNYSGGWIYTMSYILVWWILLLWMYRKQVFLRI
jgi:predicted acyltransferase